MRQNIQVDPAQKVFEAFVDFSGGMNSEITNERLRPNEYPVMENIDLSGRASARLRSGRWKLFEHTGTAQGMFFYYRDGAAGPDHILAISGRLYVTMNGSTTSVELPMFDGAAPFTFQTTKTVEAAQYKKVLFVATGTKLIEITWTGSAFTAQVVVPYKPSVMEAIYIGTNGLSPDPDGYIGDGASSSGNVEALAIKPPFSYGAVGEPMTMTAYINIPSGYGGTVDYKWEFKKSSETTWVVLSDYTTSKKTQAVVFDTATKYDVRVTVKKTADGPPPSTQLSAQYVLSNYDVRQVADRPPVLPYVGLNQCRKIILHWDRLLMSGDDSSPYQMYISDLSNPRYFPTTNTISFDLGKQEGISAMVRFQDMLVVFTKTTIQTLVGKSVEDYSRFLIHDGLGCVAGWTAKVVGNQVYFLSHEGFQALKPNPYRLETMNVSRIDAVIKTEVPTDTNACAIVSQSMYWVCFPDKNLIYRFYFEDGVWVRDKSPKLNIMQFISYGEDVYNMTKTGSLLKHDSTIYKDDGVVYELLIETKSHDLSATFNYKKLKRIYLIARSYQIFSSSLSLTVYADSAIVMTPESGHAEVQPDGSVIWVDDTQPNYHFTGGTSLGSWIMGESLLGEVSLSVQKSSIRGKCRRVKLIFKAGSGTPFELFGFGLEFKLKKP